MSKRGSADLWIIERIVPGGDGFARLPDGRAAFARGALPGDRIQPELTESKQGYVRALSWQLIEASGDRIEPACPVARECGGCDLIELGAPAQLRAKASVLREALTRTGGFRDLPDPIPVTRAGAPFGYRNRLRLHVSESGEIGLFARGSHELVALRECAVCEPEINAALASLREFGRSNPSTLESLSELEVRVVPGAGRVHLHLVPRSPRHPPPLERFLELSERFTVSLLTPPFVQVNSAVNRVLVERLVSLAQQHSVRSFVELYAGAGNFTLPLLDLGAKGIAIEGNAAATEVLRRDASGFGDSLSVLTGDVRARLTAVRAVPDLILLDPPRAGAREVLPAVVALGALHVAFCACDPVTLARDLRSLREAGYELVHIEGFDMFPQTHHVEALAWMSRTSATTDDLL